MPTWKEQMEIDARYARSLNRPGVYTMPLPEDKKQPKKPTKKKVKSKEKKK